MGKIVCRAHRQITDRNVKSQLHNPADGLFERSVAAAADNNVKLFAAVFHDFIGVFVNLRAAGGYAVTRLVKAVDHSHHILFCQLFPRNRIDDQQHFTPDCVCHENPLRFGD